MKLHRIAIQTMVAGLALAGSVMSQHSTAKGDDCSASANRGQGPITCHTWINMGWAYVPPDQTNKIEVMVCDSDGTGCGNAVWKNTLCLGSAYSNVGTPLGSTHETGTSITEAPCKSGYPYDRNHPCGSFTISSYQLSCHT
jgi:hypothetical protein